MVNVTLTRTVVTCLEEHSRATPTFSRMTLTRKAQTDTFRGTRKSLGSEQRGNFFALTKTAPPLSHKVDTDIYRSQLKLMKEYSVAVNMGSDNRPVAR